MEWIKHLPSENIKWSCVEKFSHSIPNLDYIKVIKKGKVRRAKIYYLRGLKGGARIKERS